DAVLAGQTAAERQLTEGTLAGLRFVRNQIGDEADLAEFVEPGDSGQGAGNGHITSWTWKPTPEPVVALLPRRGRAWEMARCRAGGDRGTGGGERRGSNGTPRRPSRAA